MLPLGWIAFRSAEVRSSKGTYVEARAFESGGVGCDAVVVVSYLDLQFRSVGNGEMGMGKREWEKGKGKPDYCVLSSISSSRCSLAFASEIGKSSTICALISFVGWFSHGVMGGKGYVPSAHAD